LISPQSLKCSLRSSNVALKCTFFTKIDLSSGSSPGAAPDALPSFLSTHKIILSRDFYLLQASIDHFSHPRDFLPDDGY
jgi:hypothetical protein